jgi:Mrp family chromosome partitioning ATPase
MIELTGNPPTIDHDRARFDDSRARYADPVERERISSEVVVWTPAAPPRAPSLVPETRVSVECIELGSKLDPRLTLLVAPDSAQAKAYRILRHRLSNRSDPRLIALTSAERGEGKTSCAVNLALALAEETLTRVLLFEANVREPSLARLFGFEPRECLSVQMARLHGPTRGYHIAAVAGTRLSIAAMSPDLPKGARLDRFLLNVALSELRSEYDYIVVDTSPALESADASTVTGCVDGVILVTRANKSRGKQVRAALEQIGQAPLLGIALFDGREAA